MMKLCRLRKNALNKFTIFYFTLKIKQFQNIFIFCSILPTRRAIRILGRQYALTTTGCKYLEIGNVGQPSYVEIAIGDHRGNELILFLETWKGFYEQRGYIQNCLWNRGIFPIDSISVGLLTVRFGVMNNTKLIRLESFDVRLAMTESTLLFMVNLDWCIDIMFDRLNGIVEKVDAKFKRF